MTWIQVLRAWFGTEDDDDYQGAVSLRSALSLPPAWYAHNKITGDIGRIPLDVKKKQGRGANNDLRHDGYRLLREQPNKIQAPSVFKEQVTSHAIMYGNGRAAIIRNQSGGIDELIPLMPDSTRTYLVNGEKYHITKPNSDENFDMLAAVPGETDGWMVFRDDDVLHIPGFAYNGIEGIGLLYIAQSTFSEGIDGKKYKNNQLKKGFRGKLFLEVPPGQLREEAKAREFIEAFNKSEGGADNTGKAALLREGVKANALSMSNNDAQLVELQKFHRQDVGLLFGIDIPGDGESVSYNSLEQKKLSYLDGIDIWFVKWEEQCDIKLRSPVQKLRRSHYYKFNRAAFLRTDLATTMTAFVQGRGAKILSANECREKLDMNPYEGGDEYDNPAITPGSAATKTPQEPTDDEPDDTPPQPKRKERMSRNRTVYHSQASHLIGVEINRVKAGAEKATNFVLWMDNFYHAFEPRFADNLEKIGLDRDEARIHCEESKRLLLDVCGNSTDATLLYNVEQCVKNWKSRASKIGASHV